MCPEGVHLGGEEMTGRFTATSPRRLCRFCGRYLGFSEECQYVKVNSRTKEGKNRKLNWLCCAACLKEYNLGVKA